VSTAVTATRLATGDENMSVAVAVVDDAVRSNDDDDEAAIGDEVEVDCTDTAAGDARVRFCIDCTSVDGV
jgi:hypothetical protein